MRLAELSTAEQRYLSSPLPPVDAWSPLLIVRLCRVLGARMKQRVQIFPAPPDPLTMESTTGRATPEIDWDNALDAMWVHARLGGNVRINSRCMALSRNLQRALQQVLAETWLSSAQNKFLPGTLRLRIEISDSRFSSNLLVSLLLMTDLTATREWVFYEKECGMN